MNSISEALIKEIHRKIEKKYFYTVYGKRE